MRKETYVILCNTHLKDKERKRSQSGQQRRGEGKRKCTLQEIRQEMNIECKSVLSAVRVEES